MKKSFRNNSQEDRKLNRRAGGGQGLVEFAIILPLMLMLLIGIIEFGRLGTTYAAVTSASREAARYGAAVGNDGLGTVARYKDCVGIRSAATRVASAFAAISGSDIVIQYDSGPGTITYSDCAPPVGAVQLGDRIIVRVETTYQPLLAVGLSPFQITSEAKRTIVKEVELK